MCLVKHRKRESILSLLSCFVKQVFWNSPGYINFYLNRGRHFRTTSTNKFSFVVVDKSHKEQRKEKLSCSSVLTSFSGFPCTQAFLSSLAYWLGTENNLSTTKSPKEVWSRKHTWVYRCGRAWKTKYLAGGTTRERTRDGKHFSTFSFFMFLQPLRAMSSTRRFVFSL